MIVPFFKSSVILPLSLIKSLKNHLDVKNFQHTQKYS